MLLLASHLLVAGAPATGAPATGSQLPNPSRPESMLQGRTPAPTNLCSADSPQTAPSIPLPRWVRNLSGSNLLPSPAFGRTPETGVLLGLGLFYTPSAKSLQAVPRRKSQIGFIVAYTERKQWILNQSAILSGPQDRYLIQWNMSWRNYWDQYFGIGPRVDPRQSTPFRFESLHLQASLLKRLSATHHYLGPQVRFNQLYRVRWETLPPQLVSTPTPGLWGHFTLGLGGRWVHDTRNEVVNPRRGHWREVTLRYHPAFPHTVNASTLDWIRRYGSDPDSLANPAYWQYHLDLRHYTPLLQGKNHDLIWASRFLVHGATPGIAFREMPSLGGDDLLRGYFRGTYRDRCLWAVENEIRGLWGDYIGWNLYTGLGQVDAHWQGAFFSPPRFSWGAGLRLIPNPKARTLLRIDWARTGEGTGGLYFEVNESF